MTAFASVLLGAPPAAADNFTFWALGKGVHVGGTGDVFTNFEGPFAGGVELGIELFQVELFGEALLLGAEQYMFTMNLGVDFSWGENLRFTIGAFTGPLFFLFPPSEAPAGLNLDGLSANERTALELAAMEAGFDSLEDLASQFDDAADAQADLERTAVGWNLARVRIAVDVLLGDTVAIGLLAQIGYHYMITGEEIAAGAKNEAVDRFGDEYGLDGEIRTLIRDAVGAEAVDTGNLDGFNYNLGLFLMIEL